MIASHCGLCVDLACFKKPAVFPIQPAFERLGPDFHHFGMARLLRPIFPSRDRRLSGSGNLSERRLRNVEYVFSDVLNLSHELFICAPV